MWIIEYLLPFLVLLTVVVFFHELGHFWVARRCGVRVEVFSIGFGRELLGFTDRHGTRWKLSALPLGGYVKMFGQTENIVEGAAERPITEAEQRFSFQHKRLSQRAAIVFAGPAANFILAILLFVYLLPSHQFLSNVVGRVEAGTPADTAGIRVGDRVISMNGWTTTRFDHIAMEVQLSGGEPIRLELVRDGQPLSLTVQPALVTNRDDSGKEILDEEGRPRQTLRLGVGPSAEEVVSYEFPAAIWASVEETYRFTVFTLRTVWQMLTGRRSSSDLGGVLRIGEVAGQAAQVSLSSFIDTIAKLSINLGLLNLFPIPLLDGGHLLFYGIEAVRGRPLGERAQEWGLRIGVALVLGLMVFATWNDLVHFKVVDFLRNLVT